MSIIVSSSARPAFFSLSFFLSYAEQQKLERVERRTDGRTDLERASERVRAPSFPPSCVTSGALHSLLPGRGRAKQGGLALRVVRSVARSAVGGGDISE